MKTAIRWSIACVYMVLGIVWSVGTVIAAPIVFPETGVGAYNTEKKCERDTVVGETREVDTSEQVFGEDDDFGIGTVHGASTQDEAIAAVTHATDVTHDTVQQKKRPLKILCVVGCFPLLPETFIVNQLKGFIELGHDLTIFSSHPGQKKMHPDVIKYRLLERTYYGNLPPDMGSFDIILCQFGPLGKKFLKIKKELGLKAKLVTCFRGYDVTREVQSKGKGVYKELFAGGDLFLPVCHYFAGILKDLGCDPNKIVVHHSAIDVDRFIFRTHKKITKKDEIAIASVNRLIPKKGTCYAINAVRSLLKKYPTIQYSVLGDGYLRSRLNALISKGKAQRNIKLLGWGTQEDVAKLLETADIFVLPSVTASDGNEEGIPNALKEAMAVGIPVISTPSAGIAELVTDGVTGFLVPCGDSKALAKKIEYLIKHPEERLRIGKAARERIEQEYETRALNNRLIALFYKLLNMA